ncbi:hypothetical protein [Bacillus mycoides]|uniref:hypothetical protein n=1 Tax=Bacillus mycoides TaxID=1405 RepID=UPI000992548A|nr:hypothetical protein [Bacillus mycoides]OOR10349.1 hypothetical protein BW891_29465 [Bacillus mycoides]
MFLLILLFGIMVQSMQLKYMETKKDVVINKKTDSLLPYNWLIHHVFNSQIENENELKLLLHSLVKRIIINNANDAGNVS